MTNESLTHYGILGMKWGVRRTPEQLARARGRKTSTDDSSNEKKTTKGTLTTTTKKSIKDMSEDELRSKINRLELEKKYRTLVGEEKAAGVSKGKAFVSRVVEKIGENTLTNLGTQAANHLLGNLINKMAGVSSTDTAKRIVNPQKGQSDKK